MNCIFRKAQISDLPAVMVIIRQAIDQMRSEGKNQWNENYPTVGHISSDIEKGYGFVLEDAATGIIACYGAIVYDGEPAYNHLEGEWLSEYPYVVVHRMAILNEFKGQGLAAVFFDCVEKISLKKGVRSFKIDTNYDNSRMLNVLRRLGFTYCGTIHYEGGQRMAYEKIIGIKL